jgi:hypothetical protein
MNLCDKVPPLAVIDRQPWPRQRATVNESVSVETLSSISPNDAAALARLLGQLSTTATFDSVASTRSSTTRPLSCSSQESAAR